MPGKNLTREEARTRAAILDVDSYAIALDLTQGTETFTSTTEIRFTAKQPGASTHLDLLAPKVRSIVLNGVDVDPATAYDGARIALDGLAADNVVTVVADCAYSRTGQGLHRFEDPADGRVYTYTHFEPADARRLYANFEQPDLKASFAFTVTAPEHWTVVSNGAQKSQQDGVWTFEPTKRISTYITAIAAGEYHVVSDEYKDGDTTIPLGLLCRQSLAPHLDADEILTITKQGFDYFQNKAQFGLAYPFGKYDQVFVPEYNIGAMENPGCVTFRDEYVFRSKVTAASYEGRANTILHEMAHMWFGDLVTMAWWDDLWLKESFADYMGTAASAEATRHTDAWVTFANRRKAWAYRQDQLPTTHPVVADIRDLEDAMLNFDGITYAKGASVLKQLVAYVGRDAFFAGAREYFKAHAYGNTTLGDLLAALESASDRDASELAAWSKAWLETTGVNRLRPEIAVDGDGNVTSFTVVQEGEPLRPHRIAVGFYNSLADGLVRSDRVEVDVTGARTEVPELVGKPRPELALLNDDDLTYCKVGFDDVSTATVRERLSDLTDPLARALCWSAMWNLTRDGDLSARAFLELVLKHAGQESSIGVVQMVLDQLDTAIDLYTAPEHRAEAQQRLADASLGELRQAKEGSDHQLAWARVYGRAAVTDQHQGILKDLLGGVVTVTGLTVDAELRWSWLESLAAHGNADLRDVAAEVERDGTAAGRQHAAACTAAFPDTASKAQAWRSVVESDKLPNSMVDAVIRGFVHGDELLKPYTETYFSALERVWADRSIEIAKRIVVGLYPMWDVSAELLRRTDAFLADDTLAPALRRLVLERRDDAARALKARAKDQS